MKRTLVFITAIVCSLQLFAQAPLVFKCFDLNTLSWNYSKPMSFYSFNGKFIFWAYTDTTGFEPWISDGTIAGTYMIKNIATQGAHSSNGIGATLGGKAYFSATDYKNGVELWVTDGTSAGTQMVKNIDPSNGNSDPRYLVTYNGKIFFGATEYTYGGELWVTDGTTAGTQLLKNINPDVIGLLPNSSGPIDLTVFKGKIYFGANDGTNGRELWVSDGTAIGTVLLKDLDPGTNSSDPQDFFIWGTDMYFRAKTATTGYELWKTDGTAAGTVLVKDIWPGTGDGLGGLGGGQYYYSNALIYNGKMFFNARDTQNNSELWVTDGTTAGTNMVKDINSHPGGSGSPGQMLLFNNLMYFYASDTAQNWELWKSDGTATGTTLVKDLLTSCANCGSNPQNLIVYKRHLYFGAQISGGDYRLWRSDGTATGTQMVAPAGTTTINHVDGPGGPWVHMYIYPGDSALYFGGNFNAAEKELWSLTDTTSYPCDSPTNLSINSVTAHTAIISWDSMAYATKYHYSIKPYPSSPTTYTVTTNHSVIATGLAASTTYEVCVRSVCGISGTSVWVCDTFTTTSGVGISQTSTNETVKIYPNPSSGLFAADIPAQLPAGEIVILNMNGQVIEKKTYTPGKQLEIDLRQAAKGIYIAQFINHTGTLHTKLVVQ